MITQPRTFVVAPARPRWLTVLTVAGVAQATDAVEHLARVVQVYVIGVADGNAHGLLGSVATTDGFARSLHLTLGAIALVALVGAATALSRVGAVPLAVAIGFAAFHLVTDAGTVGGLALAITSLAMTCGLADRAGRLAHGAS